MVTWNRCCRAATMPRVVVTPVLDQHLSTAPAAERATAAHPVGGTDHFKRYPCFQATSRSSDRNSVKQADRERLVAPAAFEQPASSFADPAAAPSVPFRAQQPERLAATRRQDRRQEIAPADSSRYPHRPSRRRNWAASFAWPRRRPFSENCSSALLLPRRAFFLQLANRPATSLALSHKLIVQHHR